MYICVYIYHVCIYACISSLIRMSKYHLFMYHHDCQNILYLVKCHRKIYSPFWLGSSNHNGKNSLSSANDHEESGAGERVPHPLICTAINEFSLEWFPNAHQNGFISLVLLSKQQSLMHEMILERLIYI